MDLSSLFAYAATVVTKTVFFLSFCHNVKYVLIELYLFILSDEQPSYIFISPLTILIIFFFVRLCSFFIPLLKITFRRIFVLLKRIFFFFKHEFYQSEFTFPPSDNVKFITRHRPSSPSRLYTHVLVIPPNVLRF